VLLDDAAICYRWWLKGWSLVSVSCCCCQHLWQSRLVYTVPAIQAVERFTCIIYYFLALFF